MKAITLHVGNNRDVLKAMIARGELVDSVVTDAPYHHIATVKRFAKTGRTDKTASKAGPFQRTARGFMNKMWDGADENGVMIAFDPEFWRLVWEVLKPGGYIVAFAAANGYHRMACAIEDAGFITHPLIGWTYASGMPKDHDAAKAIDKHLGKKGSVVPIGDPVRRIRPGADQNKDGSWEKLEDREYQPGIYVPATDEAKEWEGWSYGGQVRKPALEPIYVGQKPFSEKNGAANILKWGVGAVNIEACRTADGRFPANIIHDGSPEVVALFPDSKGQRGDVKGTETSRTGGPGTACYGAYGARPPAPKRGDDDGSAARFFESYPFDGAPIFHHRKATSKERIYKCSGCGERTIGKPKCSCVGTDGKAAAVEHHPTVKPVNLIASFVRYVTRRGGTVLDPFAGTGTTGAAALAEGCKAILIEMEPEYAADIRTRLGLEQPRDEAFDDLLGETECRYCANTGWFYGDKDLGPCGCPHGDQHAEAVPVNSTDSGMFKELLG
ncbi:DNA methyltransferase [Mesorhizobium sp.]|uniref:DNA methyltransferase n=1 Tax=Mesorhizobium sp. TaxID=1871066 RepID=UPI0025C611E2|nr:DNA methyltransferase [Mesorhizobium sp.]